jgi:Domain of unknown function (DUF5134)
MSHPLAIGDPVTAPAAAHEHAPASDPRRRLQLALALLWLLDAMLQFQPFMFGHGFGQMLAGSADGNPAIVARPVAWSAAFIDHHVAVLNAIFAAIQLLLGLGIAWRPTLRLALAASVAWSLAVWWLGEGFGGLLAGTASPVNGAPGAVLLYALLAVLLWPADRDLAAPFPAARAVGRPAALAVWVTLWLGLAALALLPATRAPRALSDMIADTTTGEPAWLARIDTHVASVLARHGLLASILLAAVLAAIALAPLAPSSPGRPARSVRAAVTAALAVAVVLWLAQGLGGLLTGSATDPDTAPLLALLALSFWPPRSRPPQQRPPQQRPPHPGPPDMAAPVWLTGVFAALMLTVAVYCAGRLVAARRWRRPTELDTHAGHVLMGVAMAGVLVARLRILPAATWEAVFAVGAAWFAWRLFQARRRTPASPWRCLHPAPHLAECTAMVYMFLVLPSSLARHGTASGMAAMTASGSRSSVLALLLALFMFGYVVRTADHLPFRRPALAASGPAPVALAPRCAALCKMAMGLTMGYMLVLML